MHPRFRGPSRILSRRGSIVEQRSPSTRRRSPLVLPKVHRDASPRMMRKGPSPARSTAHRRAGSVDTVSTTATSVPHSLVNSKDTPMWMKTALPFPVLFQQDPAEERNAIVTPSSTGEDSESYKVFLEDSLSSYYKAELAPGSIVTGRRFVCPTPVPIASVTPEFETEDREVRETGHQVIQQVSKSPINLVRVKTQMRTKVLKLPAVTSPFRGQRASPRPSRNATPSPFRAHTDLRQRGFNRREENLARKTERRSPMHVQ